MSNKQLLLLLMLFISLAGTFFTLPVLIGKHHDDYEYLWSVLKSSIFMLACLTGLAITYLLEP